MWDALIITPFVNILLGIYKLVGNNFGIAIILFTLVIRLITQPLTAKQIKSTTAMQSLQKDKRWIDMQAKYKNEKEKLAQEQMKLYKEMGVSPFASCLPTLIQFPIIIALYQTLILALANTPADLYKLTGHVWPTLFGKIAYLNLANIVPINHQFLWMDLGSPERVFIPGISFGIPVLAIIVVVTTYLQQRLMTPPQTGPRDQSSQMMGAMNIYMPLLMGWIALSLASGLALYFVASNLIGILQYALLGKVHWSNLLPKVMRKDVVEGKLVNPGNGRDNKNVKEIEAKNNNKSKTNGK
jgi:YidC/Oxa1 family membrane protein insertase